MYSENEYTFRIIWVIIPVFETTVLLSFANFTVCFFLPDQVTDEALIAETEVWSIFFLSYKCFICS